MGAGVIDGIQPDRVGPRFFSPRGHQFATHTRDDAIRGPAQIDFFFTVMS